MALALFGVTAGLAGAIALTRLMSGLLFGVSATDAMTFLVVSAGLTGVALLACYISARRAAKVHSPAAVEYSWRFGARTFPIAFPTSSLMSPFFPLETR